MSADCVLCNARRLVEIEPFVYSSKFFETSFPSLTVMRCELCGLEQVDHSRVDPALLNDYYAHQYRTVANIAKVQSNLDEAFYMGRGKALASIAAGLIDSSNVSSVFEIGSGYGYNLIAFHDEYPGARLVADELNTKIAKSQKIEFDAPGEIEMFDIVIASHVLEHFINPRVEVEKLISKTRVGGLLVIEVPREGVGFVHQESYGDVFHEPHLTFFNRQTLLRFFELYQADLQLVFSGTAGMLVEEVSQQRKSYALGAEADKKKASNAVNAVKRFVKNGLEKLRIIRARLDSSVVEPIDLSCNLDEGDRLFIRVVYRRV